MKSVTEFWGTSLVQGLTKKTELTTEGKTPEEVSAAIGEHFKMEGEKLTHFVNAIEVASQNQDKLSRVRVVQLAEGESAPAKAVQFEAHHYVPEFKADPRPVQTKRPEAQKGGRGGGGGGGRSGGGGGHGGKTKTSPWGLTPEEKAAKKTPGKAPKHNTGY